MKLEQPVQEALLRLAVAAGVEIEKVRRQDITVLDKEDNSPVTQADFNAHACIARGVAELPLQLPLLSEEGADPLAAYKEAWPAYWLVDPLDGTKEFIAGNGEYTVNIALVVEGRATFGVVYAPAKQLLYWGGAHYGAYRAQLDGQEGGELHLAGLAATPITVRTPSKPVVCLGSRRHGGEAKTALLEAMQAQWQQVVEEKLGSSLKLCRVAEGKADIYPRFGPTSEWDIAAGQAVLEGAGGRVWTQQCKPLCYRRSNVINPDFYALGGSEEDWRWL